MSRSPVADLVRALALLQPADDAARNRIAAQLGFEVMRPQAAEKPKRPPAQEARLTSIQSQERTGAPTVASGSALGGGPVSSRASAEVAATLSPDLTSARHPPEWLERVAPLPEPPQVPVPSPQPEPLLVPQWTRGVLSGALATLTGEGALDLERVIREVVRNVPLRRVPRLSLPSLAQGAQVLVDRGEAMMPFAADQAWLVAQLHSVVGRERLQVLRFEGCPSWGAGTGSRRSWKPYHEHHTPPQGVAILLLTDLGLAGGGFGRRAPCLADWLGFTERVRKAGCPPVAFVPYGPARWPRELQRALPILHLDPSTSARTVRRVVGRALRARTEPQG